MKRACAALLLATACAHAAAKTAPPAPAPDRDAIREATSESYEVRPYVSARAYSHYLAALLARGDDDLSSATEELRQALVYDPDSPHLHTVLAEVLLRQGRVAGADDELRSALALDPRHAPALLLSARIAVARDRPAEAREQLRAAINASPDGADAYRELVRLELAQGDVATASSVAGSLAEALRRAQQAEKELGDAGVDAQRLADEAAGAWVEIARAEAERGDDGGATAAFVRAREAQPSSAEALLAESSFLESRRKIPEARALQLRLLALHPESADVIAALARLSLEEGDADSASAHAKKLLALASGLDPAGGSTDAAAEEERREMASALLRVAVPLLGVRRSTEAQIALDGALRLYPQHPELLFYRGLALVQRGRPREGAQTFEQIERQLAAHKNRPPTPAFLGAEPAAFALDVRVQEAVARSKAGDGAEAARHLKALFAENPLDEGVALSLLEVLERSGRLPEAVQLLTAASRAHPTSEALLFAAGNALDRAGRKADALAEMRKLIAIAPRHAGALNYVGYLLTEQGRSLDEAQALLERALFLRPDDGAIADSYGFCLLRRGNAARALEELTRADHLSPGDPLIVSHLGDALLAAGRKADAAQAFRRALELFAPPVQQRRGGDGHGPRNARARTSLLDPPDRAPDAEARRVREEVLEKLRSLTVH